MIMSSMVGTFSKDSSESAKFDSLEAYLKIAQKQIIYFGIKRKMFPQFARKMLASEEAISQVAYANMIADWRYDDSRGTTKETFRNNWALGTMRSLYKKEGGINKKDISLNTTRDNEESLINIFSSKEKTPYEILEQKEDRQRLQSLMEASLSQTDRDILKMHKEDGLSLLEIAQKYNVAKQRIHQRVTRALRVLKEYASYE